MNTAIQTPIELTVDTIDRMLNSPSKQQRIAAIEAIGKRPDGKCWTAQLTLIAASTQSREVWAAARTVLWGLDTNAAVQVEKNTQFGGLRTYPYRHADE